MMRPLGLLRRPSGFTLVEMAVVLVIVGLMLGGLMMSLSQSQESTRRSDAQKQLDETEEALYGFAQANGRLPNPVNAIGVEITTGTPERHGFVPAVLLGLKGGRNAAGLLLDPWNNPVRYSVTSAFAAVFPMGTTGTLAVLNTSGGAVIANQIPAVIFTEGSNWAISTSADEAENTNSDVNFVSAGYSEVNFDDLITWISPNILYARLIAAGRFWG